MKITTLMDNLVYDRHLYAEHGLSFYIEKNERRILFDTGQSGNFIYNASLLGIDLSKVDDVVISHGHYDHTGGLYDFSKINKTAKIHVKNGAFEKKYRRNGRDYIGCPYDKELFAGRLNIVEKTEHLGDEISIIPFVNIVNKDDLHYDGMKVSKEDGFIDDEFEDEQFLVVVNDGRITVISGCSHNGITNIIETVKEVFDKPVETVIGGFHLVKNDEKQTGAVVDYFKNSDECTLGVSHCTGIEAYGRLVSALDNRVFYNHTGNVIQI